jgi:hypothetical protein
VPKKTISPDKKKAVNKEVIPKEVPESSPAVTESVPLDPVIKELPAKEEPNKAKVAITECVAKISAELNKDNRLNKYHWVCIALEGLEFLIPFVFMIGQYVNLNDKIYAKDISGTSRYGYTWHSIFTHKSGARVMLYYQGFFLILIVIALLLRLLHSIFTMVKDETPAYTRYRHS